MVKEAGARWLLTHQKAAVWRPCPFVIILKDETEEKYQEHSTLTIDPGAQTTGLTLLNPKGY